MHLLKYIRTPLLGSGKREYIWRIPHEEVISSSFIKIKPKANFMPIIAFTLELKFKKANVYFLDVNDFSTQVLFSFKKILKLIVE